MMLGLSAFIVHPKEKGQIWADCEVYETVATPTNLPVKGSFDELYMNPSGFQGGIGAISESKPGDMDYNGGRWHVNVLKSTIDPAKYSSACSVDDLDLEDFMSTTTYFVCPLLPTR